MDKAAVSQSIPSGPNNSAARSSKLPQDDLKNPSSTMYIHNHYLLGNIIQVTDITSRLSEPYSSPDFVPTALEFATKNCRGNDGKIKPTYTISRSTFFSLAMDVVDNTSGSDVARWKLPILPINPSRLTFPVDSKHCSHPIVMKPTVGLKESFVLDAVEFVWKVDRLPNIAHVEYKLVKNFADRGKVVARYSHPPSSIWKGGILTIDTSEIDLVVSLITCCIMIKKRGQKDVISLGTAS